MPYLYGHSATDPGIVALTGHCDIIYRVLHYALKLVLA